MADEGIFATTAEVSRKAGANASATSNVEAYINDYMAQAESLINSTLTFNFSDNYSTLNADTRDILKMCASAKAAMMVILFDVDAVGREASQIMLNVLRDEYDLCIQQLKSKNTQDFLNKS